MCCVNGSDGENDTENFSENVGAVVKRPYKSPEQMLVLLKKYIPTEKISTPAAFRKVPGDPC
jgi:hypothetical protein